MAALDFGRQGSGESDRACDFGSSPLHRPAVPDATAAAVRRISVIASSIYGWVR